MDAGNLMRTNKNPNFKSDFAMLVENIKLVEAMTDFEAFLGFPKVENHERSKRQTTMKNCTVLEAELADVQAQIALVEIRIANSTVTFDTLTNQVNIYTARVETSTGSTRTTNQNLLNIYKRLLDATTANLDLLRQQLDDLKAQEAQILNDIRVYCIETTTTIRPDVKSPCGKFIFKENFNPY